MRPLKKYPALSAERVLNFPNALTFYFLWNIVNILLIKSRIFHSGKRNLEKLIRQFSIIYLYISLSLKFGTHCSYDDTRTCYARADWVIFETITLRLDR